MKRILSVLLAALMLSSLSVTAFADGREPNYDEAYYSQLKGKDVSINVYNWGEYIANGDDGCMDINKEFEELTGITVNYTLFDTNESMYAKIKSGSSSYDVIFPSDYMVSRMIQEDMLSKLDYSLIPNFEYIDERFVNPEYDPQNEYSVPYTWGTVGLIYNYDKLGFDPTSWDILWDELYSGEILMFSNSRDAFGLTLMRLGYDINSQEKLELDHAAAELKAQKPFVQAYVMDQIFDKMQGNEAALAPYYAGDAVNMMAENESLRFVIPEEGSNWFADAACIPAPSDSFDEERYLAAHMYINFLNEPNVAAENIEYIQYSTPNTAALALLDEETQNNPIIYPDDELLDSCQAYVNLSTETNMYMDTLWTDLMSAAPEYNEWAMPLFLAGCLAACVAITVGKKQYRRRKEQFSYDNYRKNIMP
ncbi:MAG: spermidine/putrescine ABC transporter substrate-binding protein [Ruminococcaceae bacterium]|nr:spermidine/putrescine ABC transporter substrate-binding protein [Oscillospiraceae bacterium]